MLCSTKFSAQHGLLYHTAEDAAAPVGVAITTENMTR